MIGLNGICLNSCPDFYQADKDNNCLYCQKYMYNNDCVDKCPDKFGDNGNRKCSNCRFLHPTKKYYKGMCVFNPPSSTVITDLEYMVYVDCIDVKKKIYKDSCVDSCPSGTATSQGSNECFTVDSNQSFVLNGNLVDSCPAFYIFNEKNECVKCEKKINNNTCQDYCPVYYLIDGNNKCYSCKSVNKIWFAYGCTDKCPSKTYYDEQNNICIYCKDTNKYFIEGTDYCIDKCPDDKLAYDVDNLCFDNCKESNSVILNSKCESKCSAETTYNQSTNECEAPYKNISTYYYLNIKRS